MHLRSRAHRSAIVSLLGSVAMLYAPATAGAAEAASARANQASAALRDAGSSKPDATAGVVLDVPFVKQDKNACGAASLAMIMQYWARQLDRTAPAGAHQAAIVQALDPGKRGIANTALETYLRNSGFRTFAFSGSWSDLRHHLEKGRPLIVALGPDHGKQPLHFVVVAGIDWEHNYVFVNDPAQRKLFRINRSRFEREWQKTDHWTLLAVPTTPG